MPQIVVNDKAPDDLTKVSLGNAELDFSSGPVESSDRVVLANAASHPWLTVEYEDVDEYQPTRSTAHVAREDDVLAAENSVAFDLDEVRKVEDAKQVEHSQPVAINAGLDQDEPQEVAGVAVTHAAVEDVSDETFEPDATDEQTEEGAHGTPEGNF